LTVWNVRAADIAFVMAMLRLSLSWIITARSRCRRLLRQMARRFLFIK
jgi:hypothetical protein